MMLKNLFNDKYSISGNEEPKWIWISTLTLILRGRIRNKLKDGNVL